IGLLLAESLSSHLNQTFRLINKRAFVQLRKCICIILYVHLDSCHHWPKSSSLQQEAPTYDQDMRKPISTDKILQLYRKYLMRVPPLRLGKCPPCIGGNRLRQFPRFGEIFESKSQ